MGRGASQQLSESAQAEAPILRAVRHETRTCSVARELVIVGSNANLPYRKSTSHCATSVPLHLMTSNT